MKKIKLLSLGLLLLSTVTFSQVVSAEEKAKDEGWDVPNIALGNGLTEEEKVKTTE